MPTHFRSQPTWFAALLGVFVLTVSSFASIQDNGEFFSSGARAEASRTIAELERTLKKDVAIETFSTLPPEVKAGVNLEDKAAVNKLYQEWSVKQARLKGVNGVYILLVKSPAHLQVVVGNETQKKAFTLGDRDALVSAMLAKLRAKQNDQALLEGVNFISTTMKSHLGVAAARPASGSANHQPIPSHQTPPASEGKSGFGWLLPIVIIVGLVWLGLRLLGSLFGGGRRAGGLAGGAGGGGFLQSLLGGILGAGAGMWMYNTFFGDHGSSAMGAERDNSDSGGRSSSEADTDYSSSGDSFDSGGGDSGGGDSGGGDSGGGGDF